MKKPSGHFPYLGFGLGLRPGHYQHIFDNSPKVDWFEIISENFMDTDGRPKRNIARIREQYPVVMHGIALSIGTVDPLNSEYLKKLKDLADWLESAWISDHLCWTGVAHKNSHDLLPVPYTEEALKHIITRIKQVQDYLGRPIAFENPSTYLEFKTSYIPEAEFLAHMVNESGCNLLLDVNNVYVSCFNHRLDPQKYIDALPLNKVAQIHLSGHSNMGTHIIDTHDDHVVDEVWSLYRYVINKAGHTINTMIEWDDKIPEFEVLYAELEKAKQAAKDAQNYGILPQLEEINPSTTPVIVTSLSESQTRMQNAIIAGSEFDSAPENWIRSKENFGPAAQLEVYTNAYRYRLYDVTAEEYPVLKHYLGDEAFETLISGFIKNVSSEHFNIGRYSTHLPDFMQTQKNYDSFALELATLENAITQLTDEEETSPLEPIHLEGMTAEDLMETTLNPRKALKLFAFSHPVNEYYQNVKDEKSPAKPELKNSFTAIFRHEDIIWRMNLGENEYLLLNRLFQNVPIGQALEELQTEFDLSDDGLSANLSEWFARWMRNGLLSKPQLINKTQNRKIA